MNKYLILVNSLHMCPLDLDFKIIKVNSRYDINCMAEEKTYEVFKKLQKYALGKGYDIDIESGYRSESLQEEIFRECVKSKGLEHTKKYVALPGYSEHQTGLAIDVCLKQDNRFLVDHDLPNDFNLFLKENACKFGFIIRYPKGKEMITGYSYEPWHLRYVGNVARYIDKNYLTLEEYLNEKKNLS